MVFVKTTLMFRMTVPVLAAAAALLAAGCASTDEAYFLNTESKANVFVAPVPCGQA